MPGWEFGAFPRGCTGPFCPVLLAYLPLRSALTLIPQPPRDERGTLVATRRVGQGWFSQLGRSHARNHSTNIQKRRPRDAPTKERVPKALFSQARLSLTATSYVSVGLYVYALFVAETSICALAFQLLKPKKDTPQNGPNFTKRAVHGSKAK